MRAIGKKGPLTLDVPHELPSQFLFRVRREDRTTALADMDQPAVLRHVRRAFREGAVVTPDRRHDRARVCRNRDWTLLPA